MLTRRGLLSLLPAMLLAGCGYQLRGFDQRAEQLPYRHVLLTTEGTDGELVRLLRIALSSMGGEVVTDPARADVELWLGSTQLRDVISAIGPYGDVAARMRILTQPVRLRRIGRDEWLVDMALRKSREIDLYASFRGTLGAERPLAGVQEGEEVDSDVRLRVVESIVRLLQGLNPLDRAPA